ncbi:MAG: DUF6894 family protein [Allosphingosinicella sp.]
MPLFFFHIHDDFEFTDEQGIDMADAASARVAALAGARGMMSEQVKKGRLSLHHRIEVEDEDGDAILSLPFGDAVVIETEAA